jgi:dTDP-4-dehydrorhamnose reductase
MRCLVTGATGQLGPYLLRQLADHDVVTWRGSNDVDLRSPEKIEQAFAMARPEVVIHAAAMSTPGSCFKDAAGAHAVNVQATATLARLAPRIIFLSTDMVYDGSRGRYTEADAPSPTSVYGRTKVEAEQHVASHQRGLTIRLSLLFGPSLTGKPTLLDQQAAAMRRGEPVNLFHDEHRTPLAYEDAARAIVTAAASDLTGLFHLGGPQRLSRVEMGAALADALGAGHASITPCSRLSFTAAEPRPADTSLDSTHFFRTFPHLPRPTFAESMTRIFRTV